MTRRIETSRGAPRVAPSTRWALGCWAFGPATLLAAVACQSVAEPAQHGEPTRVASSAQEPAVAAPAAAELVLVKYEETSATASPNAEGPKAAAGQTVQGAVVQDETFSIWLQAASPVTAGSPATVEAVLVAKAPYHCNADYPHKFKLAAAPAGVTYPETTVKGMQVSAERSVLRIPVVAHSPGKPTVAGTLQFSVCNDERCLVEKRELSLGLEVL